ncbi:homoserine O-acetyltransferase [Xanthomonas sp. D-109]|uniref:homoserine O-acetyltransferase MetX n=1 Tax=Xanthomonas sp. D-109 TaxID=2821274 RepID=UPI001ADB4FAA|nr:homoserine O-acetyltransferase [Xanthomonas sp. D-109]MBO9883281.1 homoserine O-acetyltransferase [Xanthomonas sp. D-109]
MSSLECRGAIGAARTAATEHWICREPLSLELGGVLPSFTLAYRTWGELSEAADNAVIVCHALTGSADADDWWNDLFGPGRTLDPERDFIVCSNVLGGCYGSTGPASPGPDGVPYGRRFPALTIRDQVIAQMRLADALGIRSIALVVGGSMGGLQVFEWALLDPERVRSIAAIAASASHSAWCISWSETQRLALRADPRFRNGDYAPDAPPVAGLGAARAIAMTTYRSPTTLSQRYGRTDGATVFGERALAPDEFAVRSWLRHHAENFCERFDANCYLGLIDAMDRHDIGRGRGGVDAALRRIVQPTMIVAVSSDALYVTSDQLAICEHLSDVRFVEITSDHGHDGFLIDAAQIDPYLVSFRGRHGRMVQSMPEQATGIV